MLLFNIGADCKQDGFMVQLLIRYKLNFVYKCIFTDVTLFSWHVYCKEDVDALFALSVKNTLLINIGKCTALAIVRTASVLAYIIFNNIHPVAVATPKNSESSS